MKNLKLVSIRKGSILLKRYILGKLNVSTIPILQVNKEYKNRVCCIKNCTKYLLGTTILAIRESCNISHFFAKTGPFLK